ncbi:uncharacterized protein Triagg1_2128 [Trichoderma aggressivum f. europaeum]|uniref:Fe2OG dioxygenase domain-containing protein n=1 Tax=Trichoderma aggressivum f. europaeum TaxID=173218 RepID=A0AAE1JCB8_9HYPO|nr:hypothetical protein Triagg1_2128 [Trichoderma aggressivum f. europaeum]
MAEPSDIITLPRPSVTKSDLKYAETFVVDLSLDDGNEGTQSLVEVIKKSATDGIFHLVNHGIPMELLELQRDVAYTYYETTSLEQKDADTTKNESGFFEGYKLRTPEEKEGGLVPTIEEYNYDYYATGKVRRPPIMEKYEDKIGAVYKLYHESLIPKVMRLLSLTCGKEPDYFYKMHDSSQPNSEIGHYLRYHTNWERDNDKKRASYAGHTDIGSVTFLYCNPIACLQVYSVDGWRYVPYVENSLIVNIGDCLESLTGGKFPAALHRLVKFQPDQYDYNRIALVYFVHPHDNIIREHLRLEQERRKALEGTNKMSGQEVNRLIMALSADNDDEYAKIVDSNTWLRSKSGELVDAPEELVFDYEARTIRRRENADDDFVKIISGAAPASSVSGASAERFSEEQWRTIKAIARVIAKEKVTFTDEDWKNALEAVNNGLNGGGVQAVQGVRTLNDSQVGVLKLALGDLLGNNSTGPTAIAA